MNLILSYGAKEDFDLSCEGHLFLGIGQDIDGSEVHVFLKKEEAFPDCDIDKIKEAL